ncbi:hypothetical protein Srut_46570 [Streptomyces rutgersensis]|nr:hypothetical protein Srut_46570 [Streptomyces rutgersensis]
MEAEMSTGDAVRRTALVQQETGSVDVLFSREGIPKGAVEPGDRRHVGPGVASAADSAEQWNAGEENAFSQQRLTGCSRRVHEAAALSAEPSAVEAVGRVRVLSARLLSTV